MIRRRRRRYIPVPEIFGELFGGLADAIDSESMRDKKMISSTEEGELLIEFQWVDGPTIKHYPNDDEIAQLQAALARHLGERLKATVAEEVDGTKEDDSKETAE